MILFDVQKLMTATINKKVEIVVWRDNSKLINGIVNNDCLIAMDHIEDETIDMIFCDLPYGSTACSWDIIIPFDKLWSQYNRIIKNNGAIIEKTIY